MSSSSSSKSEAYHQSQVELQNKIQSDINSTAEPAKKKIKCPTCRKTVEAEIAPEEKKVTKHVCPECHNLVYYGVQDLAAQEDDAGEAEQEPVITDPTDLSKTEMQSKKGRKPPSQFG
jgi:uncharacterized radical SAM superfamily Fe-S cluster-containing enzyme